MAEQAGGTGGSTPEAWLTLNRLQPTPVTDVAAADLYAWPDRFWVRANMVSSVDGAATLGGRVGTLTGPADQRLLQLLRASADVLVVGAGTLRAEGYGPLTVDAALASLRPGNGRSVAPRLVVPTRSLSIDLHGPAFTHALGTPLIVTTSAAPPARVAAAREVAEVVQLGKADVDLVAMTEHLRGQGHHRILCEGGPALLAGLFADGLVDELCLAVAPMVTCGPEGRVTAGPALATPRSMSLTGVAEREHFVFLRYTARAPGAGDTETPEAL